MVSRSASPPGCGQQLIPFVFQLLGMGQLLHHAARLPQLLHSLVLRYNDKACKPSDLYGTFHQMNDQSISMSNINVIEKTMIQKKGQF